ncbi:MAG: methylenetetrahydrofolate reductase [Pseudonocardiales bacterium]|nr:methylenetetrahydrofolate reductase [Pseudonocardiales bacterium]
MVYGPCGGVRTDGGCELGTGQCSFGDLGGAVRFEGLSEPSTTDVPDAPERASTVLTAIEKTGAGPVVLTDLTVRPFEIASIAAIAEILRGSCDAVLVGEHQNRPDYPPVSMSGLLTDAGLRAWITLTCRDRNRLVLEQEIAGLVRTEVDGVLCVTGDGRAQGVRPGVTQVFDLDGTRLASMAAAAGLPVAVAESPEARPRAIRAQRLVQKQRAGASIALLNHVSTAAEVARFVDQARAEGLSIPVIAGVAVYTDARSAKVLLNFPGLNLDERRVDRVLSSTDTVAAGVAAAVEEAGELLAIPGVAGVNISGLASARGEEFAAEVKAIIGRAVRELST